MEHQCAGAWYTHNLGHVQLDYESRDSGALQRRVTLSVVRGGTQTRILSNYNKVYPCISFVMYPSLRSIKIKKLY